MKAIYLDIFSGISGDMFLGAMIDLGVDFQKLELELKKLNLGGYQLQMARAAKADIQGVKFDVRLGPPPAPVLPTPKGPYGGPLVNTSWGRVELSIFEDGVPPRFRLFFYNARGRMLLAPRAKSVVIETVRANGPHHVFAFKRYRRHLEATTLLPEPHEFTAILTLTRARRTERRDVVFVEAHHHHGPGHGRNFAEIRTMIQNSQLSAWVKEKSIAVFHRIAVAEGKIHGRPPEQVHFHEVGAVDSIVDIVGACVALEMLGKPRVLAASVVEGTGWIQCAHGRFPIPAPATAEILGARGVRISQCEEPQELVTPTGAALLAEFAESFGPMRNLTAGKIGYGLGTRDNKTRPNVLRAVLCESGVIGEAHDWEHDTIATLETNLDDINAEILGRFVELALAAGALDVFYTSIQMKKNRPGTLLTVLCAEDDADKLTVLILRETTAFGVRRTISERRKLRREKVTVKTSFGDVAVKVGKLDGKVLQTAPEFDSCRAAAEKAGVPIKQVYDAAKKSL